MRTMNLASVVLAALITAGCDGGPFSTNAVEYDPLPDPSVNWVPYAEVQFESDNCMTGFGIVHAAAYAGNTVPDHITQSLESIEQCSPMSAESFRGFVQTLALVDNEAGRSALRSMDDQRRQTGIPIARRSISFERGYRELEFSPSLIANEREWVRRCEGPMGLFTGWPYGVRQTIFEATGDNALLIDEWETRISECRTRAAQLRAVYVEILDQSNSPRSRELMTQLIDLFDDVIIHIG